MCVCFHGKGRNWKYTQNTSCKEHLVFQTISFLAVLGWIPDATKEWHWSSLTVLIFCSIFLSPSSVFGKKWTEMTFLWKDQLKIMHMPSSPFWMGFPFSVVFGIWMGNACSCLGSCPDWAPGWAGIRRSHVEASSPSLWHCWGTVRGKHLFSWAGGYVQSKWEGMGKSKCVKNKDIAHNGEANKYQPCYFCTNMFLMSQWCVVCLMQRQSRWSMLSSDCSKSIARKRRES